MGTAGKEVVLAGITWFSKCQGFDVVPSIVQQRSCRGSLKPSSRGRTETKLPVYAHKPAEVSHSLPVCSLHILSMLFDLPVCVHVSKCVFIKNKKTA